MGGRRTEFCSRGVDVFLCRWGFLGAVLHSPRQLLRRGRPSARLPSGYILGPLCGKEIRRSVRLGIIAMAGWPWNLRLHQPFVVAAGAVLASEIYVYLRTSNGEDLRIEIHWINNRPSISLSYL